MANAYRRRNLLSKVRVNGDWLMEEVDIKEGGVQGLPISPLWKKGVGNPTSMV